MRKRLGLVAVALVVIACRAPPRAGTSCSDAELPACADGTTALVCDNHFWASQACVACTEAGGRITCAAEGASCTSGLICSSNGHGFECVKGKYTAIDCLGPAGCSTASCDQTVAVEQSRCVSANAGLSACNVNRTVALTCTEAFWLAQRSCKSCALSNSRLVCSN